METVWIIIVALMFTTYVVLDGFDFGAGILHLLVAKTDEERRTVFASIGPLWDGNEVWLLAGGGILFFAFPRAYSAGFSGFYMPLMMVLWLLVLRGISIEFRSMEKSPLWRSAWDGVFFASSALMAIVLGAALGNVIRGVPLNGEGFFSGPLFTDFLPGIHPGVLDWYTVLIGVFSLVMLAMHGAQFLRMKTEGPVHDRAEIWARRLWAAVIVVGVPMSIATHFVQPGIFEAALARPTAWVLIPANLAALIAIPVTMKRGSELASFLSSSALIATSLAIAASGMYPTILRSTLGKENDLTITSAAAGTLGLHVGLTFWLVAIVLAIVYFTYLFRSFRGKVVLSGDGGH
ncbi:cytochrome d ubiquinol oxidase subunit II [Fimbriimonas ginsengisoli]|uniref:Cytochrome d ubiquinol oxidase subunit II n=1 Tax=Fimbriimonas ginsengisoli Gsoil 348 TaxID=661478 RepID=A0A068NY27_FIMGI|nr:cytochrome d ubiquinol oxidase subunit II [Fimbriimonas ginsengisoli]AIE86584.1 cytochrome d ubiquinol oxidase subunit II [Fimbriimonas ginsengisoli Gsoil 348]